MLGAERWQAGGRGRRERKVQMIRWRGRGGEVGQRGRTER